MTVVADAHEPRPWRSALLGFLERVKPGQRFAVYPAGGYTRACLEDTPSGALDSLDRTFV